MCLKVEILFILNQVLTFSPCLSTLTETVTDWRSSLKINAHTNVLRHHSNIKLLNVRSILNSCSSYVFCLNLKLDPEL